MLPKLKSTKLKAKNHSRCEKTFPPIKKWLNISQNSKLHFFETLPSKRVPLYSAKKEKKNHSPCQKENNCTYISNITAKTNSVHLWSLMARPKTLYLGIFQPSTVNKTAAHLNMNTKGLIHLQIIIILGFLRCKNRYHTNTRCTKKTLHKKNLTKKIL